MATYFRRDDDVQNGLGEAVPNIAVTYLTQPSLALATFYSDTAGTSTVPNPQYTNGLGQTAVYLAAGLYTITYSGDQIQTLTYPDQLVSSGGSGSGTLTRLTVTPSPDGTTRIFTLSAAPTAPTNDLFFAAGSIVPYSTSYSVSGVTLTWTAAVAPQTGDLLEYFTS